ncbi:MAG: 1-deoxy-D-xylulose-5-phosphate reductoisomerase [Bacteroidales bacterium]|nr:1-deoxy-D-xylulose-5-phosphate reductoisomerase [Bacteroidales bacterium]
MKKGIAILGATGSIGTQALEIVAAFPNDFSLELISGHSNAKLLLKLINLYQPKQVVITDSEAFSQLSKSSIPTQTKLFFGEKQMLELIKKESIKMIINALVGISGLNPLIQSLKVKKQVLLANKESIVIAGEQLIPLAEENGVQIIPIDSEHSAIFQCLVGEQQSTVSKVILTASGGPFLNFRKEQIKNSEMKEVLNHPIWNMGQKISVDSASLMNKGLEVIEARWLFKLQPNQIEVLIHPQSFIHSLVQFTDGSIKAQMSLPDMHIAINYALHYPHRNTSKYANFSLTDFPTLTFQQVDREKFRNLALAFKAMEKGGNMPAILNAANEIGVKAFLAKKWPFYRIPELVEEMMQTQTFISSPVIETYFETTEKCFESSEAYIRKHL